MAVITLDVPGLPALNALLSKEADDEEGAAEVPGRAYPVIGRPLAVMGRIAESRALAAACAADDDDDVENPPPTAEVLGRSRLVPGLGA